MASLRGVPQAGLAGRLPRSATGRLFHGLVRVRPACANCGLERGAEDAGDGPVAFIVLIVGFILLGAALVTVARSDWPTWLHLPVWLPLAAGLAIGLIRPLKEILIGLQYRYRQGDFDAGR